MNTSLTLRLIAALSIAVFLVAAGLNVGPVASVSGQADEARYIVLVLDVSARMGEPQPDGTSQIEAARDAVETMLRFFAQINPVPRVTVIVFNDAARVLYPFSNNMDALTQAVGELPALVQGSANIGAALDEAIRQLDGHDGEVVVLVTGGMPTQGLTGAEILKGPARMMRDAGHCFYPLGLGDYDAAFLQSLREVAPCRHVDQIVGVEDTPRLLAALVAATHEAEPATHVGRVEAGGSASVEVDVPGDQATLHVSTVSPDVGLTLIATDPDGMPLTPVAEGEGLSSAAFVNPVSGTWTMTVLNPSDAATTYYLLTSTKPKPIGQTQVDLLISICVAVAMILAVGLTVLAVERYRPRAAAVEPATVAKAALVNPETGARFPLGVDEEGVVYIGRAADCTVHVDDPAAELCHAAIRYRQGQYFLQDQTNHERTLLNGRPVGAARLVNGDRITVGGAILQFRQDE